MGHDHDLDDDDDDCGDDYCVSKPVRKRAARITPDYGGFLTELQGIRKALEKLATEGIRCN